MEVPSERRRRAGDNNEGTWARQAATRGNNGPQPTETVAGTTPAVAAPTVAAPTVAAPTVAVTTVRQNRQRLTLRHGYEVTHQCQNISLDKLDISNLNNPPSKHRKHLQNIPITLKSFSFEQSEEQDFILYNQNCSPIARPSQQSTDVTLNPFLTPLPNLFPDTYTTKLSYRLPSILPSVRVCILAVLLLSDCMVSGGVSNASATDTVQSYVWAYPDEMHYPPHHHYPAHHPYHPHHHYHRSVRQVVQSKTTNSTISSSSSISSSRTRNDSCEVSNIKCALRTGCGMALQKYMLDCADLINGHTSECEPHCQDSLLILTSTPEGRALVECQCSDAYCRDTKARMEVCRAAVVEARQRGGRYSCTLAHLVCSADTRCATAIAYYDKFCRRMFNGRSCSPRCNNSISILQRQDKAAQLETCQCDGSEPFDCATIKSNMARLCFHRFDENEMEKEEEATNEIDTSRIRGKSSNSRAAFNGVTPGIGLCVLFFVYICLLANGMYSAR